jgi:hypothetical protein
MGNLSGIGRFFYGIAIIGLFTMESPFLSPGMQKE